MIEVLVSKVNLWTIYALSSRLITGTVRPITLKCNGLNERFNGELVRMLSKLTEIHGKNWDLELPCALWAYRTAVKTEAGFLPYHLVYGKEAIMPIELEVMSLRMLSKLMDDVPNYFKERLVELQEMQLDRSKALEHYEQMQDKNAAKLMQSSKIKIWVLGI